MKEAFILKKFKEREQGKLENLRIELRVRIKEKGNLN